MSLVGAAVARVQLRPTTSPAPPRHRSAILHHRKRWAHVAASNQLRNTKRSAHGTCPKRSGRFPGFSHVTNMPSLGYLHVFWDDARQLPSAAVLLDPLNTLHSLRFRSFMSILHPHHFGPVLLAIQVPLLGAITVVVDAVSRAFRKTSGINTLAREAPVATLETSIRLGPQALQDLRWSFRNGCSIFSRRIVWRSRRQEALSPTHVVRCNRAFLRIVTVGHVGARLLEERPAFGRCLAARS